MVVLHPRLGPDEPQATRVVNQDAAFRDPWALACDAFLAARNHQLVAMNGTGATQPLLVLTEEERKAGFWIHEPRPVLPQPRGTVIAPRTDPAQATGRLILANILEGRNMAGVKPGEIR